MKVLEWYDRFLIRYGVPIVVSIFAILITWFALQGQQDNAWLTLGLMIFVIIAMGAPIGISVARQGPWEK